jgi:hypothetical protein
MTHLNLFRFVRVVIHIPVFAIACGSATGATLVTAQIAGRFRQDNLFVCLET